MAFLACYDDAVYHPGPHPYTRRWGTFTPYLQVLNAYNKRNVLFYFYNYDKNPPTRSGISMFPLLPSIGFEASF